MRDTRSVVLIVGLIASALIATGCGDDEESSTAAEPAAESTAEAPVISVLEQTGAAAGGY